MTNIIIILTPKVTKNIPEMKEATEDKTNLDTSG
jgi:hypothetical protein